MVVQPQNPEEERMGSVTVGMGQNPRDLSVTILMALLDLFFYN